MDTRTRFSPIITRVNTTDRATSVVRTGLSTLLHLLPICTAALLVGVAVGRGQNACDLTGDGKVDRADVQAAINMSLGVSTCTAQIAGPNVCNIEVVQRVINASLGGECLTSNGLHVVSLSWNASSTPDVIGYEIYRGTTSHGRYILIATVGPSTTYVDNTVEAGKTYYYVLKAIDARQNRSPFSSEITAVIPVP